MAERNVPIETVLALNELTDVLKCTAGINVVQVQNVDPPLKSELTFLSEEGKNYDDLHIMKAFIIAGIECLVVCSKAEFAPDSEWDVMLVTRDSGYSILPSKPTDAYKFPPGSDLKDAAERVTNLFLSKYPGDEKFVAWVKGSDELQAKGGSE